VETDGAKCPSTDVDDTDVDDVETDGAKVPSTDGNNNDSISSTQWVVVKYAGKKSLSYFLGQVLEVVDDGIKVTFVGHQPGSDSLYKFPEKEDIDVVTHDDIVDTLKHQPVMNSRQQFLVKYQKFTLH